MRQRYVSFLSRSFCNPAKKHLFLFDVVLHGWGPPRYSRSLYQGTLFTRGLLYFKPTFLRACSVQRKFLLYLNLRLSVAYFSTLPQVWQYVNLSKSIFLVDCPGVIHDSDHKNNDVEAVLKGVVRIERMGNADKGEVIKTILDIIKKEDLKKTYQIGDFEDTDSFLEQIAVTRGKLLRGAEPDRDSAARMVLHDWIRGRLPWFNAPPFESNQQFREHKLTEESMLMKRIQNYSTFNIINEELKSKVQQEEEGIDVEDEENESVSEADDDDVANLNNERESDSEDLTDGSESYDGSEAEDEPPAKRAKQTSTPVSRVAKKPVEKKKVEKKPVKEAAAAAAPAVLSPWEALKAAKKAPSAASTTPKKVVKLVKKK